MNEPLEEWVGGTTDCDKVCGDVVLTSRLLSADKSPSSLVGETLGQRI